MTVSNSEHDRVERAKLSLDGLSVGDGFGQRFFFPWIGESAGRNHLPDPPWYYTDDTEMAMAIIQVLQRSGTINQQDLAATFAARFSADPGRGYGGGARNLLIALAADADWESESQSLFGGSGSFGNGAAMRVAPLGAWFADDVDKTIEEASRSAAVTHSHIEGQVGAIAVALASGWAFRWTQSGRVEPVKTMLPWIADRLADSLVSRSIRRAAEIPFDTWAFDAANELGCGHQVSAQDTVPFCLWMAAAHLTDYCDAMWTTARVGGDSDTTCAIIGGIVALSVGPAGIPDEWRSHREPLKW
ncbi:MAG: ADP-ribosylglycohydrolase family protein [Planctomycetaceae bacterium]|jgi:ADP-ribosylglycohydrolase|nr:ADP-ribosylglycohydrolase family protein [Planctomycetaceae bacterium]MBT6157759.1 ADP-ribosylglycohydrolase family protein [Planctomycetaceae bacterium]MBT6484812.1 ADP-ribosylglycohydrolase family protein [Planctomycetaceae bacterium]MBT6497640.1 ADP-ribosylglycohydrolase family protein [Planctomycetaceae bacterium]